MLTASTLYEWIQTSYQPSLNNNDVNDDWRKTLQLSDINKIRQMDTLWAGKGIIYHVTIIKQNIQQQSNRTIEMIVKHVFPTNCRNNNNNNKKGNDNIIISFGDLRKIRSYHVEHSFYYSLASMLLLCQNISIPQPYYVNRRCHDIHNNDHDEIMIMMSYIPHNQSIINKYDNEESIIYHVLKWLAYFHASYWGTNEYVNKIVQQYQLQKYGSYWNLPTRPDEYNVMCSNNDWKGKLKLNAELIHKYLYEESPYQCLIHGDTKIDNILFHYDQSISSSSQHQEQQEKYNSTPPTTTTTTKKKDNNNKKTKKISKDMIQEDESNINSTVAVTFCDFQYIGKGSPAIDIAYFFISSIHEYDCNEKYIEYYLNHLQHHLTLLSSSSTNNNNKYNHQIPTVNEMMNIIDIAYCDFYRFMCGWGFWGSYERGLHRVKRGLKQFE